MIVTMSYLLFLLRGSIRSLMLIDGALILYKYAFLDKTIDLKFYIA